MSAVERLTPEQIAEQVAAEQDGLFLGLMDARYDAAYAAVEADRANGAQRVLDSATFADLFTIAVTRCSARYVSVHRDDRTGMCVDELGHIAHGIYDDLVRELFA